MNNILFTHTDLDGVGCAVLAKKAFGDDVVVVYCNHNDVNEKVKAFLDGGCYGFSHCYITDISVNAEIADMIDECEDCSFTLLDHHMTASWLNTRCWATVNFDEEKAKDEFVFLPSFEVRGRSGTEMFYYYLSAFMASVRQYEEFANLVADYDVWAWKTSARGETSKKMNDFYYLVGAEQFIDWANSWVENGCKDSFGETAEMILQIENSRKSSYMEKKMETMRTVSVQGLNCAVVFAEMYISELGDMIGAANPDVDFVAMINMSNGTVSYRTCHDDVDVAAIAARVGGGGHKKAAGSKCPEKLISQFLDSWECEYDC